MNSPLDETRVRQQEIDLENKGKIQNELELSLVSRELTNVDFLPKLPVFRPDSTSTHQLHTLDVSRNCLTCLPPDFFSAFSGLKKLNVSRNYLRGLPNDISHLMDLRELNALSNNLRYNQLPVGALATLPVLRVLDFRYNRKLKQSAHDNLKNALPDYIELKCCTLSNGKEKSVKLSACDRNAEYLVSQLEPLSTPQLLKRLQRTFDVVLEVNEDAAIHRANVMERLLQCYHDRAAQTKIPLLREIRYEKGILLPKQDQELLLQEMERVVWPTTARERPKIAAQGYVILQRPPMDDDNHTDSNKPDAHLSRRGRKEAGKRLRFKGIFDLAIKMMHQVDPEFCSRFTALALTKNFTGSPHIDTLNVAPFYGVSVGDFSEGGGKICVECSALTVAEVDTRGRYAKIDGRFPHWVSPYEGTRYSLIYYVTSGAVIPQTTAVFPPRESQEPPWIPPPSFVL